jgi:hypothetical protein
VPDTALLAILLDSLKDPFLFADTQHVIRYMNKAAVAPCKEGAAHPPAVDVFRRQTRGKHATILRGTTAPPTPSEG